MSLDNTSHPGTPHDELVPSRYALRVGDIDVMVISDGVIGFLSDGVMGLPATMLGHNVDPAVRAALDNVERHAGPGASAWVLVEDEDDAVTVTVRDDGAGMPAGRLEAAEREGRLGVAASIRARVEDVGGTAVVVSAPGQGTEVELRVPRRRRT